MTPDLERRAVAELRAVVRTDSDLAAIVGYAVVFDTRSRDLGGFVEVVKPQAVESAVRGAAGIVALYNHDPGAVLGRTPKTLQVTRDTRGLAFRLEPAPTQAGRDAFALVQRGDVAGASFGFKTLKDTWRQDAGVMIRELLDIEIAEISLTAFPAYRDTDVSVAQRSLQQFAHTPPSQSIAALRRQLSAMTDDELAALTRLLAQAPALVVEAREILDRMMTQIEHLLDRVEVLELEAIASRPDPPSTQ